MAIAIMISTFGCNNGLILAGARVYYAMARDGLFFRGVAKLNRQHAPAVALLAQGIWASLLTLPRTVLHRSRDRRGFLWQRLHPVARIHHLGGSGLLHSDGRGGHGVAAQIAARAAPLLDLGLSDRAADLHHDRRTAHHRSGVSGTIHFGHRFPPRPDRRAGLPAVAQPGTAERSIRSELVFGPNWLG